MFSLTPVQTERVHAAAERALPFFEASGYPLGTALTRYHFEDGSADAVVDALGRYQNADGGFGNRLEVDLASPVSNPWAARLAMQALLSLRERPNSPLIARLGMWLNSAQHEDGDWHLDPAAYEDDLSPWFRSWTFPTLNPSCCLAGLGTELGLIEERTTQRTAALFNRLGSLEAARTSDFYSLLPYIEYFHAIDHPERGAFLDAVAANITATRAAGRYADIAHFLDHALGGGPALLERLDAAQVSAAVDAVLDEQQPDGGWPNEYSAAWRPWATAALLFTLVPYRS